MNRTTLRRGDDKADDGLVATTVPPEPAAPPMTAGWASAVGNQRVARMAAEYAEQSDEEVPADESFDPLEGWDEDLAALDEAPAGDEPGGAAEGVATLARMHLARQPLKTPPRRASPLTADDVADLKRVGTRTIKELAKLEAERAITTIEAEQAKERIEDLMGRSKRGSGDRKAVRRFLNRMRAMPGWIRERAAAGRSTKGRKLVSDFKLEPPVIRVGEGEAARISFVLKGTPKSISAFIMADPNRQGTSHRFFTIDPTPGYHQVIWDGTWDYQGNRPPEPGVYRIDISVTGEDGKSEHLFEQIRVENPEGETVLPRRVSGGGHPISTVTFDGRTLILTDAGGNTIEVPATSGLKTNNKKNKDGIDYTDPKWEWEPAKGPIPHGMYTMKPGQFQLPDADKRGTKYASGGTAAKWGPMRVQILPNERTDPTTGRKRSEFFFHMDVTNDGTAGCIGIPTGEEGKFNQIMSLIATSQSDVKLAVSY